MERSGGGPSIGLTCANRVGGRGGSGGHLRSKPSGQNRTQMSDTFAHRSVDDNN